MEFEKSRTYANLMAAIAGESQAAVKYEHYAKLARKEGYEQIGDIFDLTSKNEKAHAYQWFKAYRENNLPDTVGALEDAAGGEHFEWTQMYKEFAEVAKEEGYHEIAKKMENIASVEHHHEERFRKLAENIKNNEVFKKDSEEKWICKNCGYIHTGKDAPVVCPVCQHKMAYFEIEKENY